MTLRRIASFAALTLSLGLTGCANGYKDFYKPSQGWTPETIAKMRVAPAPPAPVVERSQPVDGQIVLAAYAKRGYVMIGNTFFNSGKNETEEAAIRQGQVVGADLVLILNPRYTGSVTSSVPITLPTTSTTHSTGTATAYGPGGPVTAYGSGTSTTYGSQTTFIPMTVSRSDYGAVYFIKQKFSFGAFSRDLNDAERQEHQTNKGIVIVQVVNDTPAFDADILVGDMVVSVDGVSVSNYAAFRNMLIEHQGKVTTFSLLRHGQTIEKEVKLADTGSR
jgi:membrane-associated protease RseP (regulator of RpoE activity)